jgi:hypothetical protein
MDFFIPEESLIPPRVFDSRVDYGRLPVKSALDLKQERQGRTFRTVLSPLYHCFLTVLSLVVFHILSQFHNLCTLACFFNHDFSFDANIWIHCNDVCVGQDRARVAQTPSRCWQEQDAPGHPGALNQSSHGFNLFPYGKSLKKYRWFLSHFFTISFADLPWWHHRVVWARLSGVVTKYLPVSGYGMVKSGACHVCPVTAFDTPVYCW